MHAHIKTSSSISDTTAIALSVIPLRRHGGEFWLLWKTKELNHGFDLKHLLFQNPIGAVKHKSCQPLQPCFPVIQPCNHDRPAISFTSLSFSPCMYHFSDVSENQSFGFDQDILCWPVLNITLFPHTQNFRAWGYPGLLRKKVWVSPYFELTKSSPWDGMTGCSQNLACDGSPTFSNQKNLFFFLAF